MSPCFFISLFLFNYAVGWDCSIMIVWSIEQWITHTHYAFPKLTTLTTQCIGINVQLVDAKEWGWREGVKLASTNHPPSWITDGQAAGQTHALQAKWTANSPLSLVSPSKLVRWPTNTQIHRRIYIYTYTYYTDTLTYIHKSIHFHIHIYTLTQGISLALTHILPLKRIC